ncbi:hypothetical protein ZYGR_0P01580 [Zygosaccharomyces rouxii]|uniref:DNA polymerase n=2 Tax=Zygosaccharomyces rouxii TaxID=4956 RepID=C5E495_ZYGRC|nr:uncharacterized protein ZYRO0E04048g [Zygosaccharomyces rouxii]KAH9198287.1 DNA polymerase IV [Zygosaccharomyces rouxii]GAV49514.1 hypothetical protein ZYGR_0P01580 [Zygosaccharomyces rouxii]CAQ43463.1 DNA polymerase IV [Zygosaccharomyces rouxii]CAR30856.1 ZYRO0E04048p [Zygosaccharomyces rouxii]
MAILKDHTFLFLPNVSSSTLDFLAGLIAKEGGKVIEDVNQLDPETVVLINDSFVGEGENIIHEDILRRESDLDIDYIYDYITENSVKCVRASKVSRWLKDGQLVISKPELVQLIPTEEEKSAYENVSSDSESATDVEGTDGGERSPSKDQHEGQETPKGSDGEDSRSLETNWSKNELVIKFLDILAHRYKVKGDNFRSRGYNLAKIGIQRLPHEIESGVQAQKEVSNVGSSIAKKIQTILDTGTLPGAYESPQFEESLQYLSKCHNVGTYTARRWTNLGLKSFAEVSQKFPHELKTDWPILFGWSFYEDWSIPIPRQECSQIERIVNQELKSVDPACQVEIQGSYLRGADYCGDLDMLFHKKNCNDTTELSSIMEEVAIRLYDKGYIKCFLQLTPRICELFAPKILDRFKKCNLQAKTITPSNERIKKFYFGFQIPGSTAKNGNPKSLLLSDDQFMSLNTKVGNPCRRVDFFSCKWSELGASRLQWTGPKEFNRWLRMIAIEKGMKLTQHGLFDKNDVLIESFIDTKIFQALDQPYIGPEERNHVFKKRRSK